MLSIVFQSHLIRHSDTGFTSKDTQRVLEHLRHSGTWALEALNLADPNFFHIDFNALSFL